MTEQYANVIIDISHEKVDRVFQYRVPERLVNQVQAGVPVLIPFGAGNRIRKGYVVEVTTRLDYDKEKIKEIAGISTDAVTVESQLISLAYWMKEVYAGTMNQALKTVLPVKQKVKQQENKKIRALACADQLEKELDHARKKHYQARERLLKVLLETREIPYSIAIHQMNLTMATLKPMIGKGLIEIEAAAISRNPITEGGEWKAAKAASAALQLNEEQDFIVNSFIKDYKNDLRRTYLIHGITGSGKTEVYLEMIAYVLEQEKQVIMLIPEIALTYQTVMRFYGRFGDLVSIVNSRMSAGERFDQFERAKRGEVQIMIGPRSALFTPFFQLGLIIIDEEHENAYKSEGMPRYHAREVAQKLVSMSHASLVLGSATPSLESYSRAMNGRYELFQLKKRAKKDSTLAEVEIIDLREELKQGNKSIFSRRLQQLMEDRLLRNEQIMLFINRRGYSNFVSCRSCGEAIRCPHCDVSLTLHNNGKLVCHYCGYQIPMPKNCPSCGSPYIANFGTGTQKLEVHTKKLYPQAKILRMDLDTTSKKGGHEEILRAFAGKEADILIGTQMIVKGHDFPNVTLVGVMAADLSLNTPDFRCGERTFQLLTQAAGRAGRDERPGNVVIQTYNPEHYSIQAAAVQDYPVFYDKEMAFRSMLHYPPVWHLLTLQIASKTEALLNEACIRLCTWIKEIPLKEPIESIGPVNASVYKVNDIYRKILYIKQENYGILITIKNTLEMHSKDCSGFEQIFIQYDFS